MHVIYIDIIRINFFHSIIQCYFCHKLHQFLVCLYQVKGDYSTSLGAHVRVSVCVCVHTRMLSTCWCRIIKLCARILFGNGQHPTKRRSRQPTFLVPVNKVKFYLWVQISVTMQDRIMILGIQVYLWGSKHPTQIRSLWPSFYALTLVKFYVRAQISVTMHPRIIMLGVGMYLWESEASHPN